METTRMDDTVVIGPPVSTHWFIHCFSFTNFKFKNIYPQGVLVFSRRMASGLSTTLFTRLGAWPGGLFRVVPSRAATETGVFRLFFFLSFLWVTFVARAFRLLAGICCALANRVSWRLRFIVFTVFRSGLGRFSFSKALPSFHVFSWHTWAHGGEG